MDFESVSQLADALLYEGYLLYPYRASSVKNQHRYTFGCLLPPEWLQPPGSAERAFLHTECLLLGNPRTKIDIVVRFLRLMTQVDAGVPIGPDAAAREIELAVGTLEQLLRCGHEHDFALAASYQCDGAFVRSFQALAGTIKVSAQRCDDTAYKLSVHLNNRTLSGECRTRTDALAWSLLSCQVLLGVRDGNFLSLLDPPPELRDAAAACRNVGVYPVLVGDKARRDMMLAAPIILEDYPRIAPASPGDLFDATEMDEMLTLRIRTLADAERNAITDPQAARMLKRCDNMPPDQLLGLHGEWHTELAPGMRVRLRPSGRADAFDLALAGLTAVIVSIEQDLEDRIYVSVAVDDDPGRDLGVAGKPGHRFYFRPDEVEPLFAGAVGATNREGEAPAEPFAGRERDVETARQEPRPPVTSHPPVILIAGIGNIFFGDDAFGSEVIRQLVQRTMPAGVVMKDFGIRGFDLACALQDGYHTAILVDAIGRGSRPGTLHVLELDAESNEPATDFDMHRIDPMQVLGLVRKMGGPLPQLRLVGCEPATLEPGAELSEAVHSALPRAVELVCELVEELRRNGEPSSGRMS